MIGKDIIVIVILCAAGENVGKWALTYIWWF